LIGISPLCGLVLEQPNEHRRKLRLLSNQLHGTLQRLLLHLRPSERTARIRNRSRFLVGLCLSRSVYLSKIADSVAPLSQRAGLLALRFLLPAPLRSEIGEPGPVQPQGACPGGETAKPPARTHCNASQCLGGLLGDGHYPRPGRREGESLTQGPLLRTGRLPGWLRALPLEDRVGLRLQGSARSESRRCHHHLLSGSRQQ
jgi:hypothetical protein